MSPNLLLSGNIWERDYPGERFMNLLPFSGFSVGFCINEQIKVICYQLELRSPGLVARYDEKAGREERSSSNLDLQ